MDAPSLIFRARSATLPHWKRLCRFSGIALILLHPAPAAARIEIPDRPPDYLMDRGGVLPPEKAREISAALNACARDYDIHIYVVTLPTLGVLPSRAREILDDILESAKSKWMEGRVGALLIFDYESGAASMAESEEARRVFSSIAMNLVFADPQFQPSRKTRSSDQLERAAKALIKHFSNLRRQAVEEEKRHRANMMIFWGLAGGALLLVIAATVAKKRFPPPQSESSQSPPQMTADE